MKKITYQPRAQKALRRMPRNTANRILQKIETYAQDPKSQKNNVIRLQGETALRMRVGDWRVFMDDRGNVLDIIDVRARGGAYAQRHKIQ